MSISEKNKLIDVRDLAVYFHIEQGIVQSVDGVSFSIDRYTSSRYFFNIKSNFFIVI